MKKEYWISSVILVSIFLYMWAVNANMPLIRDDYWYALVWGTPYRLASVSDIFQSLYAHYIIHGGRMTAFLFLDSFLLMGKSWFNPVNAFLYTFLIVLIYWYSQRKITRHFNSSILLLIAFFTWIGLPHFAEVVFWMTGAAVYLFTDVVILLFLLPYYFSWMQHAVFKDTIFAAAGMFLGGVIAGWTIENTAVTMTALSCLASYSAYKRKQLAAWMVSGCLGACIGLTLLIAAPGNYVRWDSKPVSIIIHFTNQIAANGEMLLYTLPIFLFLVLAWRILETHYAQEHHMPAAEISCKDMRVPWGMMAFIVVLIISYVNGHALSHMLGNWLYESVIVPLGYQDPELRLKFMASVGGMEEMLIYLIAVYELYWYLARKFCVRKCDIRNFSGLISWRDIVTAYPAWGYAVAWAALAFINNLVMLVSPQFPGRALFGSVVFLIIGAASVLRVPEVYETFFSAQKRKYFYLFLACVVLPVAMAVLCQHMAIYQAEELRIAHIHTMTAQGKTDVTIPPITVTNEFWRHVYFDDLPEHMFVKKEMLYYYGLTDLKVDKEFPADIRGNLALADKKNESKAE